MKSGIYKITNLVNGKFYIGSAKDLDWRWIIHRRNLRAKSHCNPKLQHSWDFHGEDKFIFSILEETLPSQQILFEREQFYLDNLKPYIREIGYNIGSTASGGDNITHHPNRNGFIEKMKIINGGENNGMFGKIHSEETIEKQKNKAEGRYTLEWFIDRYGIREGKKQFRYRNRMLSERPKECLSHPSPKKGLKIGNMSDESKQKISDTKKRMEKIKPQLISDIKSGQYTRLQLCEKYCIGETAVKYYKKKLREENKI